MKLEDFLDAPVAKLMKDIDRARRCIREADEKLEDWEFWSNEPEKAAVIEENVERLRNLLPQMITDMVSLA